MVKFSNSDWSGTEEAIRETLAKLGLGAAADEIVKDVRARVQPIAELSIYIPPDLVNAGVLQLQKFLHETAAAYIFEITKLVVELYNARGTK